MYVCTFTIVTYGVSGNELPPSPVSFIVHSVLGDEPLAVFKNRMQNEGMAMRDMFANETVAPYSCPRSCSWAISPIGSVSELVNQLIHSK